MSLVLPAEVTQLMAGIDIMPSGLNLLVSDGPQYGGLVAKHFQNSGTHIQDLSTHHIVFSPMHESIKLANLALNAEYRRALIVVSFGPLSLPKAWNAFPKSVKTVWMVTCAEDLLARLTQVRPDTGRVVVLQGKRSRSSILWTDITPPAVEPIREPVEPPAKPAVKWADYGGGSYLGRCEGAIGRNDEPHLAAPGPKLQPGANLFPEDKDPPAVKAAKAARQPNDPPTWVRDAEERGEPSAIQIAVADKVEKVMRRAHAH